MPVILDTDLLTILQSGSRPACDRLESRLSELDDTDVYTTIVSYQEQMRGWLAVLNQARTDKRLLAAYAELQAMRIDFCRLQVLPYDDDAHAIFLELRRQRIRIGTMDMRIAAVARSLDFTLLSRNSSDFGQVPGLRVEDWTR
jgi:tRNA(fMet)-specific endonuclease VapC